MALGRGLKALIPDAVAVDAAPTAPALPRTGVAELPVAEIRPNHLQPRRQFSEEKSAELAASIKARGVIQPILVRRRAEGGYELIAGERRLRAVQALGWPTIPAAIRSATDAESLELALLENLQRDDLNPVEEAQGYQRLTVEFNLTQDQIAESVGKDRSSVANALRLLKLPASILEALRARRITTGHAKALLAVEEPRSQLRLFARMLRQGMTVRASERLSRPHDAQRRGRAADPHVADLEQSLQQALGTRVRILHRRHRGKIMVEYYSLDDLDRLTARLLRKTGG